MEAALAALLGFYGFDQAAGFQRCEHYLTRGAIEDLNLSTLIVGENRIQLSPRELSLLITFLECRGEVLSPEEIFHRVYGREPTKEDSKENARTWLFR